MFGQLAQLLPRGRIVNACGHLPKPPELPQVGHQYGQPPYRQQDDRDHRRAEQHQGDVRARATIGGESNAPP